MSEISPTLPSADTMLADAESATGLSDWGGRDLFELEFRSLFTAMRDSIVADAHLTPRGLEGAEMRLRDMAETRLRIVHDRRQRPEIARQRIVSPIIILGLPRAGSTFLHNLLAQDPANRAPLSWEMLFPSPPPAAEQNDPRIARAQRLLEGNGNAAPDMVDFHAGGADLPEECNFLMEGVAWSDNLSGVWKLSSYNRLRAGMDPRIAYETHRFLLQAIQSTMPDRRMLLKNPGHIFHVETLLATYPDALLVQTHRDPAKVMPSVTATIATMRSYNSDLSTDEKSIARGNNRAYATGLAKVMELRATRPEIDQRFHDVHFRQLIRAPIETARAIYGHFGLPLSDEAIDAMENWLKSADEHQAKRKFKLADFDLDEAGIESAFAGYIDHYGIERERPA